MENVPNTFEGLFWGYTTIWAMIVLYVLWLGDRMEKIERAARSSTDGEKK